MKLSRLVFVLVLSVAACAAQSIGGRYQVQGHNSDGSTYRGTANIVLTSDSTCRITWNTGADSISRGICMRKGSVFSAAYKLGNSVGLVIYDVQSNGTLRGVWTIADESGSGTETLIPLR